MVTRFRIENESLTNGCYPQKRRGRPFRAAPSWQDRFPFGRGVLRPCGGDQHRI